MSKRVQLACAWCGPIFALVFFAGMLLAGLLPPPGPSDTTSEVADFWRDNPDLTRLGLLMMLIAGGLTAPWGALIAVMLKRIEGPESPMTYVQIIGAAAGVLAILIPTMIFMVAAFRPDRNPDLTQTLNDLAWVPFVVNFPPALLQCLSVSGAVFEPTRERRLPALGRLLQPLDRVLVPARRTDHLLQDRGVRMERPDGVLGRRRPLRRLVHRHERGDDAER